ncbi:MAG: CRISPR-associated endonuclease Cas2 [Chloroflexi bacterium]|nr:MAG: CRISPR-associated endonuclease Cas2 [Chloroflexota bacterium]
MFIVVSYDIPDDKRRTKVMKTLKDFGRHVQYSVFECELKPEDYRRLRIRLKKLVNLKEDDVRFYVLSREDLKKRRVWGVDRDVAPVKPWYIVG